MSSEEMQYWIMVSLIVIAGSFLVMAIAVVIIAFMSRKVLNTVEHLDEMVQPLFTRTNTIGLHGEEMLAQFVETAKHLSSASKYFADSAELINEEVIELKQLVGMTAVEAKAKVELINRTIEQTQVQVVDTTQFIQAKVVQPAAEFAAIMAGVRKGLEVLFAPSPKQIDRVYQEDEMFIG